MSYYPDYQRLENIFRQNDVEQIECIINDSLDFYNSLISKEKNKVKE